jgi:NADP-dependent 3-hydroxy acid dehydrogenase YdfG
VFAGARKDSDLERADRITPIKLDVTRDADVNAIEQLGAIDILVNNRGVASYGNPVAMNFDDAVHEMDVNYFGALRTTRAVAPGMWTVA